MRTPESVVRCDPGVLGGVPVFAGTRVPLRNLFDSLVGGDSLEQAVAAIETAGELLSSRADVAR